MLFDDLLRPVSALGIMLVAGPWDPRPVEHVLVLDHASEVAAAPRGAVALLTPAASAGSSLGARLELLLRTAGERQLAALGVCGTAFTSEATVRRADRSRVALLSIPPGRDVASLAAELERRLRSGADAMLQRLVATLAVVEHTERRDIESILAAASRSLGAEVSYGEGGDAPTRAPVVAGGSVEGYVRTELTDASARIGCRLVADAIGRLRAVERGSREAERRARGEAVAALVRSTDDGLPAASARARSLGLPVDGAQVALAIEPEDGTLPAALLPAAQRAADDVASGWHAVAFGPALLLVGMRSEERADGHGHVPEAHAQRIVGRLVEERPHARLFCGVSRSHRGPRGLRTAVAEARSALAAACAAGRANAPLAFRDSTSQRLMLEVVSSDVARSSVDELLAPLDALGSRRAETAVRTLQVYLDERGSLARAGKALHLHPNAVAYRIRQIRQRLGVDLDDADQRLALQLACRARLLLGQDGAATQRPRS